MESAAKAVSTMNNALFFGKPLKVFFSKNKSHIIAKADGTYAPPTKNEPNKRPADSTESSGMCICIHSIIYIHFYIVKYTKFTDE